MNNQEMANNIANELREMEELISTLNKTGKLIKHKADRLHLMLAKGAEMIGLSDPNAPGILGGQPKDKPTA